VPATDHRSGDAFFLSTEISDPCDFGFLGFAARLGPGEAEEMLCFSTGLL
jgi:hypothetical protein